VKRTIIWVVVLSLLAVDFAALDDITTGNEPSYFLEYAILIISLLIFGVLGFITIRKR